MDRQGEKTLRAGTGQALRIKPKVRYTMPFFRKKRFTYPAAVMFAAAMLTICANGAEDAVMYEPSPAGEIVSYAAEAHLASGVLPGRSIDIYIDGEKYSADAFLYNSVTYVGLRRFSNAMGADVSWNEDLRTAYVNSPALSLSVTSGADYMIANGRYLWCSEGTLNIGGTLYVPVRALCRAFGSELYWDGGTYTVHVTSGSGGIRSGADYYDSDTVYWLSRIISAESRGEPLRGKIAVGNVVLNRVKSSLFPNTVYGVIFDSKYGVQFTPTANGTIYNEPDAESIAAAKLCLDGAQVSGSIMYFINPRIAESMWVVNTCSYVTTIGNHDFYS